MYQQFMVVAQAIYECASDMSRARDPFAENPDLAVNINSVNMEFQLYGSQQEIAAMNEFVEAIKARPLNVQRLQNAFNFIAPMVRLALRNELGIEE